jgi:hypothetical protein
VLNQSQIRALNVAEVRISYLTPQQIGYLSTAQIQSLITSDFSYLSPLQIPLLTTAQAASISTLSPFSVEARAAFTQPQVRALDVAITRIHRLTPTQVSWLTVGQIQSLQSLDFEFLSPAQIPYLTPLQISTISSSGAFGTLSDDARAALTQPQVQALDVALVGLNRLTVNQIKWLTAPQIQTLQIHDLIYLRPNQMQHISTAQMGSMTSWQVMDSWSPEQRAAVLNYQIRALRPEAVRASLLTSLQISTLRVAQLQAVMATELHYLTPSQIKYLTNTQIAGIPTSSALGMWSDEARAALTASQIPFLNVAVTRIHRLTTQQINWLTVAQVRSLLSMDFEYLTPEQIPYLKPAQVYSISTSSGMNNWTDEARAALTYGQVRLLNTTDFRIHRLTPLQIGWLRTAQIQAVQDLDFLWLHSEQIPKLTPQQFSTITSANTLRGIPDESRARISNEQLLSLPWNVLSDYILSPANTNYHPAVHMPIGPDGIPIAAHLTTEANRFFALVPLTAVTHRTVASGDWSNPAIWQNGIVPSAGAKVMISAGNTVRFDSVMSNFAINTLRVDGTLQFAVDRNTELRVDTVVVMTSGKLHIGTAANPIQNHVTAKILIADNGPINTVNDPYKLGRGITSHGEVRMHGEYKTPYATLAVNPIAGATQLQLSSVPTNWTVGDRLVITGHMTDKTDDFGADEVTITAINGNVVTVTPLHYGHSVPAGHGLSLHVANLSRNIIFASTGNPPAQERPHMVFFHNPNVQIENIGVFGFGRTDKSIPINDPVVVNGVLQPGTGTNPRARYAIHFHHTSVNPVLAPAFVRGSVVDGSPGWGFVNHSSNVNFEYNVAYRVNGASFVGEDGNEIGTMLGNLSINATGSWDGITSRPNHDWGFGGHGFWMQGPGIKLIDNIAAGSQSSGFVYFTATEKNLFDAVNLAAPNMAYGHLAVPVGMVPAAQFKGNTAYATGEGLEIWHHLMETSDQNTYIDDFTVWGARHAGMTLHYAGRVTVRNAKLINDLDSPRGTGISTNDFVHDLNIQNLTVIGFFQGVESAIRGTTIINNAYFATPQAVYIGKGRGDTRQVQISGAVTFATLTPAQLNGLPQWDVYATGAYDTENVATYQPDRLFAQDQILVAISGTSAYRVSFYEQLGSHVPFPSSTMTGLVPDEYLNRTNSQLYGLYGVSFAGELISMAEMTQIPRVYGLIRYGL